MAKVWKVIKPEVNNHQYPERKHPVIAHEFFSLFQKVNGKWTRVSLYQYPEKHAYTVWGDFIRRNCITFAIRKVNFTFSKAQGASRFIAPRYSASKEMIQSSYQEMTEKN